MSQLLVSEGSSHVLGTTNVPATCLWRLFTCTRNNKCPSYLSLKALDMYSEQQISQLLVSEGSWHVLGTTNVPVTCLWRLFTCIWDVKCPSYLCTSLIAVLTAVQGKVTKTVPEKQLLRKNFAARQSLQLWKPNSTSLLFVCPWALSLPHKK